MKPGSAFSLIVGKQIIEPDRSRGRSTDYLVDMQMMAMFR